MRDRANTSNDPANRSSARSIGATPAKLLAAFCLSVVAVFAALAPPALAAETHPYTGISFGPDGVGGTERFGHLQGTTVDTSGYIYAYDSEASKIYKFDSAGAPADFSATSSNAISGVGYQNGGEPELAVAPPGAPGGTAGDIYLAWSSEELLIYASSGTKLGLISSSEFEQINGVATDPSGNIYLGISPESIKKYTPTANPPKKTDVVGTATFQEARVGNMAVDGLGHVYVSLKGGEFSQGVYQLDGLGDTSPTRIGQTTDTLAVETAANHLFANRSQSSGFAEYKPNGTLIGVSGRGELVGNTGRESQGIGVNGDGTKVYAGSESKLKVFGQLALVPDVEIEPTDGVSRDGATFHGTVSAAGGPGASCEFQYVTRQQFSNEEFANPQIVACEPPGPFTGETTNVVEAATSGLHGSTEYLVRLVGNNANGGNSTPLLHFTTPQALSVSVKPATEITGTSAQANATVNPEGIAVEECVFEYGAGFAFDHSAPCVETSGEIGTGNDPASVHAAIAGLERGIVYRYRLRASNSIGSAGSDSAEFRTRGPLVGSPGVVAHDTTANFSGKVNPNFDPTTYRFEYVTKAQFEASEFAGAAEAPVGGAAAGSGSSEVEVEAEAGGLQPNTEYVLRLVATNASGDAASLPVSFRTYAAPTSGLPDGRAYEQVTPATALEKNAVSMNGDKRNESYATPSGDAVTYGSVTGAGETASGNLFPLYITRRGANSWSSVGFNPPASTGTIDLALGFTEDLSGGYTVDFTPGVTGGIYLYEPAADRLVTISTAPGLRTKQAYEASLVAESAGGNVVTFESRAKLTPDGTEGKPNVYAWSKSSGKLQLVGILPDGTPMEGAFGGPWDYVNYSPGFGGAVRSYYTQSSLSRDGSKAFFTAEDGRQLYMREDPTSPTGTTTLISGSQKTNGTGPNGTDPNGPQPAKFLEATPSGRYVFFMSQEALTNDANTGSFDEGQDLYRYDTATGDLIDLAPEPEGAGTEAFGLIGTSTDGSYVYFVAGAALAPGASQYEQNIYLWHQGEPIQYVATLVYGGEPDEENFMNTKYRANTRGQKAARVTPDGRTLLFSSQFQPGLNETYKSAIFRWELGGNGVNCVSCNPTGLQQSFYASLQQTPDPISTPPSRSISTRNLSSDGKRVFFSTSESLVPNDVNGVEDVYEWEANGKGSCASEGQNGGCISLISTGTSPENSYISDISESGDDVFFFTAQRLVGQDKDDLYDEYDARVGGGLASQNPTPVRPCEGEACLGAGTAPTAAQPRGTSTFAGSGNEKPKKHKKKHKKHSKKKHKKHSKQKSHRNSGGNR